jgi:hypothetical protein
LPQIVAAEQTVRSFQLSAVSYQLWPFRDEASEINRDVLA